jgi:hypothetical protein
MVEDEIKVKSHGRSEAFYFVGRKSIVLSDGSRAQATMYKNPIRTHDVSATEPNRLMLFGETVAVHYENRTEHTDAVREGGMQRF